MKTRDVETASSREAILKNDGGAGKRTRVGLIEIGSRATRLLVADVLGQQLIEIVATRVEDTRLMESCQAGDAATKAELSKIQAIAARFREQATRLSSDLIKVFGTEAVRQVQTLEVFRSSPLASEIDEILDGRTEAACSLMAGISGLKAGKNNCDGLLVIDQGAGSMEMATGRCGPPVEMLGFASVKLGGNVLLKLLRDANRDMRAFQRQVIPIVEQAEIPTGPIEQVVIQGTVATKCAWLVQRGTKSEKYDPRRVHGTKVRTDQLEVISALAEKFSLDKQPAKKWAELQDFVNPGEHGGDAGERVASGIVPLIHLLKRLGKKDFVVSAYGTRHGMACRLASQSDRQTEIEPPHLVMADRAGVIGKAELEQELEAKAPTSDKAVNVKVERKRVRRKKTG